MSHIELIAGGYGTVYIMRIDTANNVY